MRKLSLCFSFIFLLAGFVYATGIKDSTFGENGTVQLGANTSINDVVVQPDGKIVIAGYCTPQSGGGVCVIRLLPSGATDVAFGTNGATILPLIGSPVQPYDAELQPDGKIIVSGATSSPGNGSTSDFLMVRFNADGSRDASFANNGVLTINQDQIDRFSEAKVQPDGKIVAVGRALPTGVNAVVMRFNSNGTFDTTFTGGGILFYSFSTAGSAVYFPTTDIEVLPDGKILCGGALNVSLPQDEMSGSYLLRLNSDGTVDTTFGPQGLATHSKLMSAGWTETAFDMEKLSDGALALVDGAGLRFMQPDGATTYFPQDGGRVTALEGVNTAVTGGPGVATSKFIPKEA